MIPLGYDNRKGITTNRSSSGKWSYFNLPLSKKMTVKILAGCFLHASTRARAHAPAHTFLLEDFEVRARLMALGRRKSRKSIEDNYFERQTPLCLSCFSQEGLLRWDYQATPAKLQLMSGRHPKPATSVMSVSKSVCYFRHNSWRARLSVTYGASGVSLFPHFVLQP